MKPRTMRRFIWVAVIAIVLFAAYDRLLSPYEPTAEARAAVVPNEDVDVLESGYLTFSPGDRTPDVGLVFYPGARVPPAAYAPLARQIADAGYLVVVPDMLLGLAVLSPARADEVLKAHPDIDAWVIGGHSLGGAMAANFAEGSTRIDGVVLVAAYPGESTHLEIQELDVLVIYGDADELATPAEVEAAEARLPDDTEWVRLSGANHTQFGSYRGQRGDGTASMTAVEQRDRTAAAIIRFLRGRA